MHEIGILAILDAALAFEYCWWELLSLHFVNSLAVFAPRSRISDVHYCWYCKQDRVTDDKSVRFVRIYNILAVFEYVDDRYSLFAHFVTAY